MTRIRISSVYHRANAPAPTGAEAERRNAELYQRLWQERGVVVIDPRDVLDDWTRQAIENIANQRYGRRGTR